MRTKLLIAALMTTLTLPVFAQSAVSPVDPVIKHDTHEVRHDRRDIAKEKKVMRHEKRELKTEHRELKRDRHARNKAIKEHKKEANPA